MTSATTGAITPAGLEPALDEFVDLVSEATDAGAFPHAAGVEQNVVVYHADRLRSAVADEPRAAAQIRREMADVLDQGPGIMVIKSAFEVGIIDRATETFERIITAEKQAGMGSGDHYAKPGANDRVWNALEKMAVDDPPGFVDYYANDMLALGALAWLGPGYQVTSQINVVNPGAPSPQCRMRLRRLPT